MASLLWNTEEDEKSNYLYTCILNLISRVLEKNYAQICFSANRFSGGDPGPITQTSSAICRSYHVNNHPIIR